MLLWFCDEMIFAGKVPFFRDLGTYTYPLKFSLAKSLQAGEMPLWDRHMASGFPLLAAFQPGVFYPANFAFLVMPFYDAIRLTFFFHYLIAATGAYFLCRWWKHPIHLSIVAAALFAIGGTTVSLSNLLNHFQTAVWLPWMVLCWERALLSRTWRSFILLSLVLLCALLAGSPEIYLLSMGLLVIDAIRLRYQEPSVTIAGIAGLLIASNGLVAALGMVQLLPTFELLSHSRRDQTIPIQEATAWSLRPLSLTGLFLPDKEVDTSLPIGVRLFFAREIPFLLTHYLGVLSLVAICAWSYLSSRKERIVMVTSIAASVVLAFGGNTPVYGFLFDTVPMIRNIRFPEKFFFFTYACLLFAVCRGLVAYHHATDERRRMPLMFFTAIFLLSVSFYTLLRSYPELLTRLTAAQAGDTSGVPSMAATQATILFHLERQSAIMLVLLLLLFCQMKKWLGVTLFEIGIVAVAIFDLGLAHKPFQFLLEPGLVTKRTMVTPTFHAEGSRLFYYPPGGNLHPSFVSVLGRPGFVKATALNTENLLPNTGAQYGFDYFQEIDALTRQPYNDFLNIANLIPPDRRIKLLRALNVKYVVSFRQLEAQGLILDRQFADQFSWLYQVREPVPRAYIASSSLTETQPAKIIRILSSDEFEPMRQVIVDGPITRSTRADVAGNANIIDYGNRSVTIKASANGAGILVLADSYYPGWQAFVDGRESKILRANYFFRGVELPAGEHEVRFEYDPWSFTLGLWISLVTVSLVVVVTLARTVRTVAVLRTRLAIARLF